MGRTATEYTGLLKALLPRGRAWSREAGTMPELLAGMAEEAARVDALIESLLSEKDTRYTTDLVAEHEEDFDLLPGSLTLAERRLALNAALTAIGGQNKAYFIAVAAALGYTITIDEFRPAWCGVAVAGDPCGDQEVLFYWRVNVAYDADMPYSDAADLQIILERYKPAHTILLFRLAGPEFSNAFSSAFDAMPALTEAQLSVGAFSRYEFSPAFDIHYGGAFNSEEFDDSFDTTY